MDNDRDKSTLQNVFTEEIKNFPPSVKFVLKILQLKGMLTQKEIIDETYLPDRTVRYALNKLKIEGIVEERLHRKDARQVLYGIKNPIEEDVSNFACGFV
ncbi:MAG: helix-turn-helix domain-containing protein [Methanosarcinaceae archaeon]|nr:helix-turn-helix domain-containing protein [Methanosarcinaceae archaeon]